MINVKIHTDSIFDETKHFTTSVLIFWNYSVINNKYIKKKVVEHGQNTTSDVFICINSVCIYIHAYILQMIVYKQTYTYIHIQKSCICFKHSFTISDGRFPLYLSFNSEHL